MENRHHHMTRDTLSISARFTRAYMYIVCYIRIAAPHVQPHALCLVICQCVCACPRATSASRERKRFNEHKVSISLPRVGGSRCVCAHTYCAYTVGGKFVDNTCAAAAAVVGVVVGVVATTALQLQAARVIFISIIRRVVSAIGKAKSFQ